MAGDCASISFISLAMPSPSPGGPMLVHFREQSRELIHLLKRLLEHLDLLVVRHVREQGHLKIHGLKPADRLLAVLRRLGENGFGALLSGQAKLLSACHYQGERCEERLELVEGRRRRTELSERLGVFCLGRRRQLFRKRFARRIDRIFHDDRLKGGLVVGRRELEHDFTGLIERGFDLVVEPCRTCRRARETCRTSRSSCPGLSPPRSPGSASGSAAGADVSAATGEALRNAAAATSRENLRFNMFKPPISEVSASQRDCHLR